YLGNGTFTQTGGIKSVSGDLKIGFTSVDSIGTYNLSNVGSLSTNYVLLGDDGTGIFNQTGGTHAVNRLTTGGIGTGVYNLSAGSLTADIEIISEYKNGTFNQTGGTHNAGSIRIGELGGHGIYNLSAGSLSIGSLTLGINWDVVGTFNQTGGTHTVGGLVLGDFGNGIGFYNLSGGSVTVIGDELIGDIGKGTFSQTGGTHVINGQLIIGDEYYKKTRNPTGVYKLIAGDLSTTNVIIGVAATTTSAVTGTGTFTQTGGTHIVSGTMTVATSLNPQGDDNFAFYNLNGGNLTAANIVVNSGGHFNFNGGTLSVGNFTGNLVNNGGTLAPGSSPGITNISGDYTQSVTGIFAVEIGGLLAGTEYDVLNISGIANLDGTLNVSLDDFGSGQFSPQLGDSFDVLLAQQLQGSFSTLLYAALDPGLKWQIEYLIDAIDTTDVVRLSVVAAVPLPTAFWLFSSGLLGLFGFIRKPRAIS
ncbi:MAG: hypothetical protein AB1560_10855, partial [Pseudomonadota bacterium]